MSLEFQSLDWSQVEEIAKMLHYQDPGVDPFSVSLGDLYERVVRLPRFVGRKEQATQQVLEDIQDAWYNLTQAEEP
ncbi:MAG: Fe-S assembly protein IscX [Planctomycetota bacterium]|nr:MAG: Fe-S assembly protein IscX [Planctomycetota bacterium]